MDGLGALSLEDLTMTTAVTEFITQGQYLRAWSAKTVETYQLALKDFVRAVPDAPAALTRQHLAAFVLSMRERGLSNGGCNLRIRTVNSFLTWLHEEGHTAERLRVKLLKNPARPIDLLADADVKRLLAYRPTNPVQRRAWTLTVVLLDTGLRISEVLGLERQNVNLDDCVLRVLGKGHKERLVPLSVEGRKHLFRYMQKGAGRYVFGVQAGGRLVYRNAYRDLTVLCKRVGITGATNPHAFRHAFAVNYIRAGGDIYRLSRILGHSSISTTQLYLRSMGVEHLREGHHSPLMR
jgi:site-specific recombinase XerD